MVNYFNKPIFLSVIICIFFFYSGVINFSPEKKVVSLIDGSKIDTIKGTIISSPSKTSSGQTYSCLLKLTEVQSKSTVSSAKGYIKVFIPATEIESHFPGKLYSKSKNNSVMYEAGGFYTFRGKYSKNYFVVNNCINSFWSSSIFGKIDFFRALCRLQFKRLMFSWGNGGGLLLALLSGSKEYTEEIVSENFRNAGLSHILALSGMHLSMFSFISLFIGSKLKNKKATYFIKFFVLTIFVWFAGFSPSLLRAYICSMLLLLASIISYNKPDMIIILCLSFIIQCLISPLDINNTGFMLSYSALAGILLFNNYFSEFFTKVLPEYFSKSLSASCSAQIFTIPISLKLFGAFSPIGIIATTIISPLITIFIYSGLFLIVTSLIFPGLSYYSGIFVNFLYTIIKYLVFYFSKVPRVTI